MPADELPVEFGHWLAGFSDGEACFDIHPVGGSFICRFTIGLRVDDLPVLREIQQAIGLGDIRIQATQVSTPQARYTIARKAECAALVAIFDRFPLRAKKARDFALWREGVAAWLQVRSRTKHDWTAMAALRQELRDGRRPDAPAEAPVRPPDPQLRLVA